MDLSDEAPDPKRPIVCFDELPSQIVAETRRPVPARPGRPARTDYEYRRAGTATLFLSVDPARGWRHVSVTDRRTTRDFAHAMRALVDACYPAADVIRLVSDNLTTPTPAALYAAFPPTEARRSARTLEFHHTPKHGSWLNIAEIELSVLSRQCLDRRVPDATTLQAEIAAWQARRNAAGTGVDWRFTTAAARLKLKRLYPSLHE